MAGMKNAEGIKSEAKLPATARLIRSAYSPRLRVKTTNDLPSLTKQSFVESCDINTIMAKYQRTGMVDHVAIHGPRYGDFNGIEFHQAQNIVAQGQTMFNELPSSIREKFEHDPSKFLDYVNGIDENTSHQELYEMGLTQVKPPKNTPEKGEDLAVSEAPPIDPT